MGKNCNPHTPKALLAFMTDTIKKRGIRKEIEGKRRKKAEKTEERRGEKRRAEERRGEE